MSNPTTVAQKIQERHLVFAEGAKAALDAALAAWCKTCVSCSWYTVVGGIVKRIDLP